MSERRYQIRVCRGPECGDRRGSAAVYDRLRAALAAHGLAGRCDLGWQSCFGRCTQGINVLVREVAAAVPTPATALYNGVVPEDVEVIVQQHLERGALVASLIRRPELLVSFPIRGVTE